MVRGSVWGGLHATQFEGLVGDKFLIVEKKVGEWVWGAMRHVHTATRTAVVRPGEMAVSFETSN